MKKLTILVAFLVTMVFGVNAQKHDPKDMPSAKERAEMQTKRMTEKLELTESQAMQVESINLTAAEKMDEVMKMTSRSEKYKAARSAQKEKDNALEKVLSPDQFDMYLEHKAEMKKKMKEKRKEMK